MQNKTVCFLLTSPRFCLFVLLNPLSTAIVTVTACNTRRFQAPSEYCSTAFIHNLSPELDGEAALLSGIISPSEGIFHLCCSENLNAQTPYKNPSALNAQRAAQHFAKGKQNLGAWTAQQKVQVTSCRNSDISYSVLIYLPNAIPSSLLFETDLTDNKPQGSCVFPRRTFPNNLTEAHQGYQPHLGSLVGTPLVLSPHSRGQHLN